MTKKGQEKFSRISAVPVCHCHLRADCGFAELAIGKDYNCNILQRNFDCLKRLRSSLGQRQPQRASLTHCAT